MKKLILLLCSLSVYSQTSLFAANKSISNHRIILQTSYKAQIKMPVFKLHSFDLQYPTDKEVYHPTWSADSFIALPQYPLQHWQISSLTKSFTWAAKLFYGNQGKFEAGVMLFQAKQWSQAGMLFDSISNDSDIWGQYGLLWEAWSLYKAKRYPSAQAATRRLWTVADKNLQQEAFYLDFVIAIRTGDINLIKQLQTQLSKVGNFQTWNDRLKLAFIISLGELEQWQGMLTYIHIWENEQPIYTATYDQMQELKAFGYYMLKNYRTSWDIMQKEYAQRALAERKATGWGLWLWLAYFNNHCDVQEEALQKYGYPNTGSQDEMNYLSLLCQLKQKKWQLVRVKWKKLHPDSLFFNYAVYAIYMATIEKKEPRILYNEVKKKIVLEGNMGFYALLMEANAHFNSGDFNKAGALYARMEQLDVNIKDRWISRYNQGLTELQKLNYQQGQTIFATNLLQKQKWQPYHLLYALFQLKNYKAYIAKYRLFQSSNVPLREQSELHIMYALSLWNTGQKQKAISLLEQQVNKKEDARGIVFYIHTLYETAQYQKLVNLLQGLRTRSVQLYEYELESLYQLNKMKQAQRVLAQAKLGTLDLIPLRIRILEENKSYVTLEKYLVNVVSNVNTPEDKITYYKLLANTSFNQGKYKQSYVYLDKALTYAKTKEAYTDIEYEQFVLLNHLKDKKLQAQKVQHLYTNFSYIKDNKKYNAQSMLIDFWLEQENYIAADKLMRMYMQEEYPDYRKVYIRQLYVKILLKDYTVCMALVKHPPELQTQNNIDRILLGAQCAKNQSDKRAILNWLNVMQKQKPTYRTNERMLVALSLHTSLREYKTARVVGERLIRRKLTSLQTREAKFYLAKAYYALRLYTKAMHVLPELEEYDSMPEYNDVANLYAALYLAKKDVKSAIKMKLRLLYALKETDKASKQGLYLDIAELYAKVPDKAKMTGYYQKIDQQYLSAKDKQRYKKLQVKAKRKTR